MNRPTILIDSREKTPLTFENFPARKACLISGDYSAEGLEHVFSIERKSVADLTGSLSSGRERFERELHRLRGFDYARLLIVGQTGNDPRQDIAAGNYRAHMKPTAILASITALEIRYKVPVLFAASPEQAAMLIERVVWYTYRETLKRSGSSVPATPKELLESLTVPASL